MVPFEADYLIWAFGMAGTTRRTARQSTRTPVPRALSGAIREIDNFAGKRYGTSFDALALAEDRNRASAQMRHIVGLVLKRAYSDEIIKLGWDGEVCDYRWQINPRKLRAMPESAWQFRVLASDPRRRRRDTGKSIARRLHRETLLQRRFFRIVHPYLCQDSKTRREIQRLLKECGLGEYAGIATPKGLVKTGAIGLFGVLTPIMSAMPAAAVAVTALSLCVTGLNRICRPAGQATAPAKKSTKKPKARATTDLA